ncbi:GH25 family lysozyme [Caenibacillus caldisaponilyticus]|uniref:GH25 family lysozyme n=1 Tax=Caenibacillus caldisaponilyticus TaxID=1674942 RepID=UPI0009888918|nr:GH25 family lysozyme [Caenibacillus caldisaponilyticus]
MSYIRGIDVSHHQGDISWAKVDDDIRFVFVKATEGTSYVDPKFHTNVSGARTSGKKVGAYHFARFSNVKEAQAEALHFLSVVNDYDLDFHILDLEVGAGDLTDACKAFFEVLRDHKRGGLFLYSFPAFMRAHLKPQVVDSDVKLWIAHHGAKSPTFYYWPDWSIWQYSSTAKVNGIAGNVDVNYAKPELFDGAKPASKPKAKPAAGGLLRRGDRGPAVKDVQLQLNAKGFNCGAADGIFGPKTESAVKSFQKAAHIAVDGIVGPQTRAALAKYQKPKAASKKASVPYPGHLIKRGSRGKDVERVQRAVGVKVDGIFGPQTEAAVKAYQKRHGLAADGIVGPKTWAVMF